MKKEIVLALLLGLLVITPSLLIGQTKTLPPLGAFPDLIGALKSTEGCLGVESARTAGGKQVIFAWFENKKAVMNWYYSDAHIMSMRMVGAGPSANPMSGVPDEGPVLAIASVSFAVQPEGTAAPMSISQIAIELYQPLPGGLAAGGRFAPSTLKVPGLREIPIAPPSGK